MSVETAIFTGAAGQGVGSLVGPAAEAGKGIYSSLKRKYEYIKNLGNNIQNLENEAEYLSSREKDVTAEIDRNQVMMERTSECATWLSDVRQMKSDLNDLKIRYQKVEKLSCGLCGPCQLHNRLKLSRKIVKVTQSVVHLRDRMKPESILLRERPIERVEKKFPKKMVPTLHENVEKLLELLKDDNIKKVGIWGMPGVGKTTILQNLNNEVEKLQMFDIVLMVTVSKEMFPHQIQKEILKRLGLKVEGTDAENHAANLISKSLEKRKYLLLLDEVNSEFSLHGIGINEGHTQGKVVVATREKTICHAIETDDEIKVERLSRNDARNLLREAVGETFEHPGIKPIAEKVLIQCGDLPQVIKAVGIHLKGRYSEDFWRHTLSRLQSPIMCQLKHMEDVFTAFQIIYDELGDTLQKCFLYGASFPEDYEIYRDFLVECWKLEQLTGIDKTLRKACEEGHSNLESLIDRCLFDRCKSTKYVKIPIIFRNAALETARLQKFEILAQDDEEQESHPPVEKWRDAKVVSLVKSCLAELPKNPECFKVSTLFLQKNENLSAIPASFFASMPTLRILDLYGTGIRFLPASISMLTNLRGLYLNDCHQLVHLPEEIDKLQKLEVLDTCRTAIHGIPIIIGKLSHLQCLRVSFPSDLSNQNHVECNGVDKIFELPIRLEELTIDADPRDPKWNKIAPRIAAQLANLRKLSSLSFYFPTAESLEAFTQTSVSWKNGSSQIGSNFRSFNIFVGSHWTHISPQFDVSNCSGRRYLQYSNGKDIPNVIKEVLRITCAFRLIGHQTIKHFSDFGLDKMEGLEVCEVKECNIMSTVVESNAAETRAFPWLQELHLLNLQQLDCLYKGPVSSDSFARLTTLTVYECPNLSKVVSWEMAKRLVELHHLRVEKCSQVNEVIEKDSSSSGIGVFPKLKFLELLSLEGLACIYAGDTFKWQTLRKVEIFECENLSGLCLNKINATKLHTIRCSKAWWAGLSMPDETRMHFQDFCSFIETN